MPKEIRIPRLGGRFSLFDFWKFLKDLRCDCARQQRRNGVSDLPEATPLRHMKAEPVGIRMKARGFANGDATRGEGMYRARRRKRAVVAGGSPSPIADYT
jgi:hypothetical protein